MCIAIACLLFVVVVQQCLKLRSGDLSKHAIGLCCKFGLTMHSYNAFSIHAQQYAINKEKPTLWAVNYTTPNIKKKKKEFPIPGLEPGSAR